jgi:3-hydroxy acid dehydrogenase / malonic semialdehyde reductase
MSKKHIVITGGSIGIGLETARLFSKNGYRITLIARREEKLNEAREEISDQISIFPIDITNLSAVETTFYKILEKGPIDILVNNAGAAFGLDLAQEADLADWEKCIDLNIKGLLYCTQKVLPAMVERNSGHIINIGSVAATYPYPGGNVYGATKAFLHQFSLNLRADLLGTAVRVTCIEPGLVGGTEFSTVRFKGDEARASSVYAKTEPLLPENIAETIYFCANVPSNVNINSIELMPVMQAFNPLAVHRKSKDLDS